MINKLQLSENIKTYIATQLDSMSKDTPIIGFIKPIATRVLNNNFTKITGFLDLIADNNGNIDIENIVSEMVENIMNTNIFTYKIPFIGDVEIGGGQVKFNIPLTDKRLILSNNDFNTLKEILITNKQ